MYFLSSCRSSQNLTATTSLTQKKNIKRKAWVWDPLFSNMIDSYLNNGSISINIMNSLYKSKVKDHKGHRRLSAMSTKLTFFCSHHANLSCIILNRKASKKINEKRTRDKLSWTANKEEVSYGRQTFGGETLKIFVESTSVEIDPVHGNST